ncbi:hypothetical protein HDU93_005975 [Gonapodya sp. JEL0774]|nr:hypothetical protein HDU93_005975 [Gonapodya sp. JEL0774]
MIFPRVHVVLRYPLFIDRTDWETVERGETGRAIAVADTSQGVIVDLLVRLYGSALLPLAVSEFLLFHTSARSRSKVYLASFLLFSDIATLHAFYVAYQNGQRAAFRERRGVLKGQRDAKEGTRNKAVAFNGIVGIGMALARGAWLGGLFN